jgi:signal transduction histidine kinase
MIIAGPSLIKFSETLTEQSVGMLDSITAAGYRMLDMINSSLDLFKMERGAYTPRPERVELLGVIGRILEECESRATARDLVTDILVDGQPPGDGAAFEVWAEELLCHSMLANLFKNAVEASPRGETITISLGRGDQPCIRLHNRGAVPEDIRECFFEKYATSGKQGGTGLGTYSAKLITETLSGTIAMESSEADGTTLIITLPPVPPTESA